jgi:hypothetical protein
VSVVVEDRLQVAIGEPARRRGGPSITVLDRTDRYTQLAATTVRDPDTPGVHHALAAFRAPSVHSSLIDRW